MTIGPEIATLDAKKDPYSQAIANALRKLGLGQDAISTALTTLGAGGSSSGLAVESEFRYTPVTYAASVTPIFPPDVLYYTNRIQLTGNIVLAAPYGIQTGQIYTIILEADSSTRTATFSSWYGYLTATPISIAANTRYILTCVSIDAGTTGRQISILTQGTTSGGTTWTGPTLIAPTLAGSWTLVNGLSLTDSVQGTLIASKSTTNLGLALKALPVGAFDVIIGVQNIIFGNLVNDLASLPTFGVFVTNGTTAGASNAYGVATYKFNGAPGTGFLTRQFVPINTVGPAAITAWNAAGVGLVTGATYWFRIAGTTGTGYSLYCGDGLAWEFITTQVFACTHFGFGIDPTGGIASAASPQSVRIVSCSL